MECCGRNLGLGPRMREDTGGAGGSRAAPTQKGCGEGRPRGTPLRGWRRWVPTYARTTGGAGGSRTAPTGRGCGEGRPRGTPLRGWRRWVPTYARTTGGAGGSRTAPTGRGCGEGGDGRPREPPLHRMGVGKEGTGAHEGRPYEGEKVGPRIREDTGELAVPEPPLHRMGVGKEGTGAHERRPYGDGEDGSPPPREQWGWVTSREVCSRGRAARPRLRPA